MRDFLNGPWASGLIAGIIAVAVVLYNSGALGDRVFHNETAISELRQDVRSLSDSHNDLVVELAKLNIELHYVREGTNDANAKLDKLVNSAD